MTDEVFTYNELRQLCDKLAQTDNDIAKSIIVHGYPPLWSRPNTYETLVWIILEQQVSLASAKAALDKLRQNVVSITPEAILTLNDAQLRQSYVSRQKSGYIRDLANAIINHTLNLAELKTASSNEVRQRLTRIRGIGDWTADVYLIMVLHRTDIFPFGDVAAVTALKKLKGLAANTPKDSLVLIVDAWKPYRSIATMLLWHFYLSGRSKAIKG